MSSDRPLPPGTRDTAPSRTAQARLSDALRDRAEAYRQDAAVDLTMVEALLKVDEPEAAARTIDDHREALLAMARDLQVVVADAAVEREAEAVCDAVHATLARPAAPAAHGLRRRVLTLAGAAAVALALLLPTARLSPRTTLTSVEGGSAQDDVAVARERLEAARTWARVLRSERATPPASRSVTAASASGDAPTATTSLAADVPGGSTALSSSAEVVDLDAYRARHRQRDQSSAGEPAASRSSDESIVDVPAPPRRVPDAGVPLNADLPVAVHSEPQESDAPAP